MNVKEDESSGLWVIIEWKWVRVQTSYLSLNLKDVVDSFNLSVNDKPRYVPLYAYVVVIYHVI